MKQLLLYNLGEIKEEQILSLCSAQHIAFRKVLTDDYLETLGSLLNVKDAGKIGIPFTGIPFTDEMLVFHNFKEKEIDKFLEQYKSKGIESIHLKAQTTMHNIDWNSLRLHDELAQEHKYFSRS